VQLAYRALVTRVEVFVEDDDEVPVAVLVRAADGE